MEPGDRVEFGGEWWNRGTLRRKAVDEHGVEIICDAHKAPLWEIAFDDGVYGYRCCEHSIHVIGAD